MVTIKGKWIIEQNIATLVLGHGKPFADVVATKPGKQNTTFWVDVVSFPRYYVRDMDEGMRIAEGFLLTFLRNTLGLSNVTLDIRR